MALASGRNLLFMFAALRESINFRIFREVRFTPIGLRGSGKSTWILEEFWRSEPCGPFTRSRVAHLSFALNLTSLFSVYLEVQAIQAATGSEQNRIFRICKLDE